VGVCPNPLSPGPKIVIQKTEARKRNGLAQFLKAHELNKAENSSAKCKAAFNRLIEIQANRDLHRKAGILDKTGNTC
jgi:hypothetical protein